ncbi:hypothetical protein HGRIS_011411 [Hohenbuehelia grisea]|uniref:Uncharacterized protein n=1 Tax=Hohenbuehelia grisea TaxID=104357 RepID=A0ABR3JV13_9AGAR
MPLFKKNHDKTHDSTAVRHTEAQSVNNDFSPAAIAANATPASGVGYSHHGMASGAGAGTGIGHEPPMHGHNTLGSMNNNNAGMGAGVNDPYAAAGVGHNQGLPPTSTLSSSNQNHPSGSGQRMTGKIEHAVGSMLGSNALKAKGLQKEQEANEIKLQGQELAEAERLEQEALLRRERAVAHGAHPDNRHHGGNSANTGPY